MDIDTISLGSWKKWQRMDFVIAQQDSPSQGTVREGKIYGLCNAAMASAKASSFSSIWLESYKYFRSSGHDSFWDEHSVVLPANLTDEYAWLIDSGYVTVLDSSTMWKPLWYDVDKMLLGPQKQSLQEMFPKAVLIHLWDSGDHASFAKLEQSHTWFHQSPYGREAQKYVQLYQNIFEPS